MVLGGTRPLQTAKRLEPKVAHAAVPRRQSPDFVPDILGGRSSPVAPEPPGKAAENRDVVARVSRRLERLAYALDAPLAACDGALRFAPRRGGRKDHIREFRGLCEENILHDEMVQPLEETARAGGVSF